MSVRGQELVQPPAGGVPASTMTVAAAVAPYYPPPAFPPPGYGRAAPTDSGAVVSLAAAIFAIVLGLPLGLPGLALGPFAYFLGKSAVARIAASQGALGGRSVASSGWVLGIVATAIGAVVTLVYLVLILLALSAPPS